jgi:hypothetical protein
MTNGRRFSRINQMYRSTVLSKIHLEYFEPNSVKPIVKSQIGLVVKLPVAHSRQFFVNFKPNVSSDCFVGVNVAKPDRHRGWKTFEIKIETARGHFIWSK